MVNENEVGTIHAGDSVLRVIRRVEEVGPTAIENVTIVLSFTGSADVKLSPADAVRLGTMMRKAMTT